MIDRLGFCQPPGMFRYLIAFAMAGIGPALAQPVPGSNSTASWCLTWDSNTTVAAGTTTVGVPFKSGKIVQLNGASGGTTPSFSVAAQIAGVNVTGCTALTVNSSTQSNATCTAANTFTGPSSFQIVISGLSGTPKQAYVCIVFQRSVS